MKKPLLAVLCVILVVAVVAACAPQTPAPAAPATDAPAADSPAAAQDWSIGITLQNYENPYWAGVFSHVERILNEKGIAHTILDSRDSAATQISQIESFIQQGVDLIMVHPSDPFAIEDVARQAMDAGILFMSWDDVMENSDLNWILDNEVLGREIGTAAANFINEHYTEDHKAQVAIMNFPMTPILADRENGIEAALNEIAAGRFEIVARQPALDAATAQSHMETILQAHPDVRIVASIGAGGDIGANEAFMVATGGNIPDDMGIFSADATLQQLEAIMGGEATRVTVGFEGSSKRTAEAVVEVYLGLLRGDDMPRDMLRIKTPMDINNAQEFIADYQ
jgi:ribose transport system substrate-binding protein